MTGRIHIGIGGWTYEPWRGVFYPPGLVQKRELEFASRALTSIEINGTYYSTFKPDSWMKWRDETPDGFIFAVKASRYCTNRKVLAGMGESMGRFLDQGLTALGDKLGPINWQFMNSVSRKAARSVERPNVKCELPLLANVRFAVWCQRLLSTQSGPSSLLIPNNRSPRLGVGPTLRFR